MKVMIFFTILLIFYILIGERLVDVDSIFWL